MVLNTGVFTLGIGQSANTTRGSTKTETAAYDQTGRPARAGSV